MSSNPPNYLKLGLLVMAASVLLIFGLLYLKNQGVFQKGRTFYVKYENISGLRDGDDVVLLGYRIGYVKESYLDNHGVMVVLKITDQVEIPEDSKFQIVSTDLLGSKGVKLLKGSGAPALSGDTLFGTSQTDIQQKLRRELGEDFVPELEDFVTEFFDRLEKLLAPQDSLNVK